MRGLGSTCRQIPSVCRPSAYGANTEDGDDSGISSTSTANDEMYLPPNVAFTVGLKMARAILRHVVLCFVTLCNVLLGFEDAVLSQRSCEQQVWAWVSPLGVL